MRIRLRVDQGLFGGLAAYFLYVFWFQYAVNSVPFFLLACGLFVLFMTILWRRVSLRAYWHIIPISAFLIVSFVNSALFSIERSYSLSLILQIVQYFIPMMGLYIYVGKDQKKLSRVAIAIFVSVALLAISTFTNGVVTTTNAVTVGELNSNTLSSYILLGTCCVLIVLTQSKRKWQKLVLFALLLLFVIVQFNAASRRGVIILLFLLVTYAHTYVRCILQKKKGAQLLMAVMILLVAVYLLSNSQQFLEGSVILERFMGSGVSDALRQRYQKQAWKMFLQSPLVGNGLGAVSIMEKQHSHSLYYELLATTGIAGFGIIMVWFLFVIQKNFVTSMKKSKAPLEVKVQSRNYMWFVVSILISGLAVTYIYDSDFYILIGLLGAWLNILHGSYAKKQKRVNGEKR